jgi:uncharacterized protein (TIGR03067 family)
MIQISSLLKKLWRMVVALAAVMVVAAVASGVWYYYEVAWYYRDHDKELITCDQTLPCVLKERERLQGRWVRDLRGPGCSVSVIYADTWKIETNNDFYEAPFAHFRIDPRKRPKQMDVIARDGTVCQAIYELEGDTLKVCWRDLCRLTAMLEVDSPDRHLEIYRRVPETKSSPIPTTR